MSTISLPRRLYSALGDGARSNRYDVLITLKDNAAGISGRSIGMLCKSTSFPGRTHEIIDFVYKGRSVPIRGQSAYDQEWACTFYLTEDHGLRDQFASWIESLDEVHNYVGPSYANKQRSESHNGYTRDIKIYQQNFDDTESTAEYTLYNVFPKSVDAVDLNGSDATNLLEYRVTFAYSHYTVRTLDEGTSTLVDKAMAALENGLNAAADAIMDSVNSALSEGLAAAGDALGDLISDASDDETFEKLIDGATDFFYDPGGWMNDIATSVGSSIGSAVSGVVDSAKNSIKDSFK